MPALHQQAELEEVAGSDWATARARVQERVDAGGIVVLLGERGTGKTQLAVECLRACCAGGKDGFYRKATDLFREFRSCFREQGPDERSMFDKYADAALLVIDEAHRRGHSAWENVTLTDLIDHRYDAMKPTLLISNETRADFAEAIGPSVVSRIHEVGVVIECNWPSFRQNPKQ